MLPWLLYFAAAVAASVSQPEIPPASLTVAQCRVQCLEKFLIQPKQNDEQCKTDTDCSMCWETCDLLQQNFIVWGSMCNHDPICFSGCQQACSFFVEENNVKAAVKPVASWTFPKELALTLEGEGRLRVTWSSPQKPSAPRRHLVYVLLRRTRPALAAAQWQPALQTTELTGIIQTSPGKKLDLLLIAVAYEGVVAEIRGIFATPTMAQDSADTHQEEYTKPWRPEIVAFNRNKESGSVDIVVTWESQSLPGNYLVTWELLEGSFEVTGHLYTDANTVSLTLSTNAVYRVQLELVSDAASSAIRSDALLVDTRYSTWASANSEGPFSSLGNCDTLTIIAGVVSAILLITVICLCYIIIKKWICRRKYIEKDIESSKNSIVADYSGVYNLKSPLPVNKSENMQIIYEESGKISDIRMMSNHQTFKPKSIQESISVIELATENSEKADCHEEEDDVFNTSENKVIDLATLPRRVDRIVSSHV